MKKITSHYFSAVILVMALFIISTTNAQVGINITSTSIPAIDVTKTLDVNGDARLRGDTRLDGALLPGNAAGGVDQMLLSQGTATPPVWGPGFINTSQITNIAKWYVPGIDIADATFLTVTVPDPDMTVDSQVSFNFVGPLPGGPPGPAGPQWGNDFRVFAADPGAGQVKFYILNTSGFNVTGLTIAFIAYYH